MLQAGERNSQSESVQSTLNYIIPGGEKPVTESNLPGAVRVTSNTGNYQAHPVTIRNGRLASGFSLDKEGFLLVKHETKMKDFYNDDEVKRVYYPEIEQLVKQATGAARVLVFDHTLRAENDAVREEKFASRPVRSVHNDYTEWSGPQRVRDLLPQEEAEGLMQKRFSVIQVWRPVRNPVVSAPLAIADSQSIAAQDLIGTERRYPDRDRRNLSSHPQSQPSLVLLSQYADRRSDRLQMLRFHERRPRALVRPCRVRRSQQPG